MATKTKTKNINNNNNIGLKEYPIVELDINEIKEDPSNPNIMTLEQSRGLEKSMLNFGRLKFIVVDQSNTIIDGYHRLEVEKAIGTQKIKVLKVNVKDEIEKKMMRETLNKLHGEYDKQKESNELLAIFENQRLDEVAELLAQPKQNLENLISRYNPHIKFEREEDESKLPSLFDTESFVKRGEIWLLGSRHYLMCGDNQTNDLKDFIQDIKISQLNTDPPYGVNYSSKDDFLTKSKAYNNSSLSVKQQYQYDEVDRNYTQIFDKIFQNINFADYNTIFIWSTGTNHLFEIKDSLDNNNIKLSQILVWNKNTFVPARTDYLPQTELCLYGWKDKHKFYGITPDRTTILSYNKPTKNDLHPTMKPVEMIKQTIKDGTKENEIVLDVFGGSGTTLLACEQTNRICYMMEIDEHYCSVIIKRWEMFTNQKAEKVLG